jgi:hypothetical protein
LVLLAIGNLARLVGICPFNVDKRYSLGVRKSPVVCRNL